jgi:hypothetical protein
MSTAWMMTPIFFASAFTRHDLSCERSGPRLLVAAQVEGVGAQRRPGRPGTGDVRFTLATLH